MPFGPSVHLFGRREQHRLRAVCTYTFGLAPLPLLLHSIPHVASTALLLAALDHCRAVSSFPLSTGSSGPHHHYNEPSQKSTKSNTQVYVPPHHQLDILSYLQLVFLHSSTPSHQIGRCIRLRTRVALGATWSFSSIGSCSIRLYTCFYTFVSTLGDSRGN